MLADILKLQMTEIWRSFDTTDLHCTRFLKCQNSFKVSSQEAYVKNSKYVKAEFFLPASGFQSAQDSRWNQQPTGKTEESLNPFYTIWETEMSMLKHHHP